MDSNTSEGNQSWIADGLSGTLTMIDGKTQPLTPYNLINAGSLTLPVLRIAAALNNPTTSIRYMGQVTENGDLTYQIRLVPPVEKGLAVISRLDGPGIIDLFLDSATYQLVAEVETLHGDRNVTQTYSEEIDFSNYQPRNGIVVPLTVVEKVSGQQTWSITLGNVTFNTGLSDADFATSAQ
ncbi:MAG: LolA-like protein [Candidatus Acidiferrales bacterium]